MNEQVAVVGKNVAIVVMEEADLDEVLVIENVSFPTPWSRSFFLRELSSEFSQAFVAKRNVGGKQRVVAYLFLWFGVEEVHVLNLACAPPFRRQGTARRLLNWGLCLSRKLGAKSAVLEVRPSNAAALGLYGGLGFTVVGVRRGYYSDTREDALIMARDIYSFADS
jgi:ribosomal-protein-alanine N-acetyltransferase